MSRHIAIEDFAADCAGTSSVHYGADLTKVVATLRRFADLIEKQNIGVSSIKLEGECDRENFTTNVLTVKFFDWGEH